MYRFFNFVKHFVFAFAGTSCFTRRVRRTAGEAFQTRFTAAKPPSRLAFTACAAPLSRHSLACFRSGEANNRSVPGSVQALFEERVKRPGGHTEPMGSAGYYRRSRASPAVTSTSDSVPHYLARQNGAALPQTPSDEQLVNYSSLLTGLQLETRLDLAAAIKSGSCTIQFDETLDVTLDAGDRNGAQTMLYLHAVIGSMPHKDAEALLTRLMQLHLFGLATSDGVFGLEPQSRHVLFFQTVDLARLTDQEALAAVEAFVNQAIRWREYLPQLQMAALPETPSTSLIQTA